MARPSKPQSVRAAPAKNLPGPVEPRLPALASGMGHVRAMTMNTLVLLLIILIAPVIGAQFFRSDVIIEPISVPAGLQNLGLTPEVAASRLADALAAIDEKAGILSSSINVIPRSQKIDFAIPDSGLSIDSLVYYVRQFFRIPETRISGEIRCADEVCDPDGLSLRLRVSSLRTDIVQLGPKGNATEDSYFGEAASEVMGRIEPFVAIAAMAGSEPDRAEALARQLIGTRQPNAEYAQNLLGNIMGYRRNNWDAAIEAYRAAIAIRPGFIEAQVNLARALAKAGRKDEAFAAFSSIAEAHPNNPGAREGLADYYADQGRAPEAVRYYLEAAERDARSPAYFRKAGQMLLVVGKEDEGVQMLSRALQIDPADPGALYTLSTKYFGEGRNGDAAPFVRAWAGYQPKNVGARHMAALVETQMQNYGDALVHADAVVALAPESAAYHLQRADILFLLKDYGRAISALEALAKKAPRDPEIQYQLARNYYAAGNSEKAVAAYSAVLSLDPDPQSIRVIISTAAIEIIRRAAPVNQSGAAGSAPVSGVGAGAV